MKSLSLLEMLTDKSRLYSLLAAVSLLSLLAFLLYWNFENYNRNKKELKQELTDQMDLAIAEYQDSVIQRIFRVIDIDSFGNKDLDLSIEFSASTDSFVIQDNAQLFPHEDTLYQNKNPQKPDMNLIMHHNSGNAKTPDSMLTVMYDEERDRKIIVWNEDAIQNNLEIRYDTTSFESIDLNQGTQRNIKQVSKFSTSNYNLNQQAPQLYASIHKIYKKRLDRANLNLDHTITTSSSAKKDKSDISIAFTYGNLPEAQRPNAIFKGYQKYIFKKIFPSLFLSLVLLSAVAASFFVIIRNWKAQLRLAAVKDEFVSNMTHELKTPISTVGVALEALGSFGVIDDKNKREEYLEISRHELDRLKILVDKVLKMSTLDQDLDSSSFKKVDFKQLLEDMLHSMNLHFKKNNVAVDYNSTGDNFELHGDKVHLVNVLYNIIDNAIKYAGDKPRIKIDIASTREQISLKITDNGKGIDKEYLPKIFDRLFRVPTDAKHNVKGHGLGLHYAKSVIEKHRGTITASSAPGVGTSFLINIPR